MDFISNSHQHNINPVCGGNAVFSGRCHSPPSPSLLHPLLMMTVCERYRQRGGAQREKQTGDNGAPPTLFKTLPPVVAM